MPSVVALAAFAVFRILRVTLSHLVMQATAFYEQVGLTLLMHQTESC